MKKFSALLSIIAGIGLLVSCTDAINTDENEDSSYEIIELECGSTYAEIQLATEKEHSGVNDYTLTLKDASVYPANQIDFELTHKKRTVEFCDLKPDSDYVLEVSYNFSSGFKQSVAKTFYFSTRPVYVPDFCMEYDSQENLVIIKAEKENLANMCNRINIMRSVKKDGDYEEIGNEYLNSRLVEFTDKKDIEPKTTYYYKFKLFDAKDSLLAESIEPVLFNPSRALPLAVSKKTLKTQTGLSGVTVNWEAVESADYYELTVSESGDTEEKIIIEDKTENTSYVVKNLEAGKKIIIRIYSVNEVGRCNEAAVCEAEILEPKITDVSVLTDQTDVQYLITTSFDVLEENCSVSYSLRKSEKPDSEKLVKNDFVEPVIIRDGLIPETKYKALSSAVECAGYIHMKLLCRAEDGKVKEYTSVYKVPDFYTDGFDVVSNLTVSEIKRDEVELTFDELSEKQKFGQKIKYQAYAYYNGKKEKTVFAESSSSPMKIKGLEPGRYYTIKLLATSKDKNEELESSEDKPLYEKFFAETEAATESGLSKPVIKNITEELKTDKKGRNSFYTTALNIKWDRIKEDSGDTKIAYGIEYKVLEKSKFTRVLSENLADDGADAQFERRDGAVFSVNAGNRYKVRVFAYELSDPECLSYSDVFVIQTKPADFSFVPELTFYGFWKDGRVPYSNLKDGYNFNFINLSDDERKADSYAFMYSFDKAGLDEPVIPRLLFLDRSKINPASLEYGLFDEIYITIPDSKGYVLETFGNKASASGDLNMPKFEVRNDELKSVEKFENSGIQIKDSWLYNNSVYISVRQKEAGNLGFSYFY